MIWLNDSDLVITISRYDISLCLQIHSEKHVMYSSEKFTDAQRVTAVIEAGTLRVARVYHVHHTTELTTMNVSSVRSVP